MSDCLLAGAGPRKKRTGDLGNFEFVLASEKVEMTFRGGREGERI